MIIIWSDDKSMNKNLIETVLGALVLIGAAVFLIYGTKTADVGEVEGYVISASFSEIGALNPGDDVRISGVKIGSVAGIDLNADSYLANINMSIDPDIRLPDDTGARIMSEGLMGGVFIALEPGGSEEYLNEGGRIAYTQDAQNLEQLLGKFIFSLSEQKTASNDAAPASSAGAPVIELPPADQMF